MNRSWVSVASQKGEKEREEIKIVLGSDEPVTFHFFSKTENDRIWIFFSPTGERYYYVDIVPCDAHATITFENPPKLILFESEGEEFHVGYWNTG